MNRIKKPLSSKEQISYSELELQKIKEIEIKLLQEIDLCCQQLGIRYFIAYGTALGAVRHKGFIPWDDDIDIGLLRKDYEVFLRRANEYFCKKNMFLEHIFTEEECPYTYAKVRMNDTEFIEYPQRNLRIHHGIFVDVLPFDVIPEDIEIQRREYNRVQFLSKLFVYRQTPDISVPPSTINLKLKNIIRRTVHYLLIPVPARYIYKKINKIMTAHSEQNSGIYGCYFYPKLGKGYMSIDMVENLQRVPFENIEVYAPGNIEQYLKSQYGEYMVLPPIEDRVGHRPYHISF